MCTMSSTQLLVVLPCIQHTILHPNFAAHLHAHHSCSNPPPPALTYSALPVITLQPQPQGLLKASGGLQPSLLIDSSTILPTYTSELAQRIHTYTMLAPAARKVAGAPGPVFVDAPVSGGVIGAVAGTLTFMVGAAAAAAVACAGALGANRAVVWQESRSYYWFQVCGADTCGSGEQLTSAVCLRHSARPHVGIQWQQMHTVHSCIACI
jgi:hypothetical protein